MPTLLLISIEHSINQLQHLCDREHFSVCKAEALQCVSLQHEDLELRDQEINDVFNVLLNVPFWRVGGYKI